MPALLVDGKLLTENAAILAYLDRVYPNAKLLPRSDDPVQTAQIYAKASGVACGLLFVDETDMADLNEQYMGKPGATDVLAFPLDAHDVTQLVVSTGATRAPDRSPVDPGDLPLLLGDVVELRHGPRHMALDDAEPALRAIGERALLPRAMIAR